MEAELFTLISTMRFPLLTIVIVALIKTELINLVKGMMFRFDRNFNEGDPIILKGKKARIVKIGLFSTIIYMEYEDKTTMRKFNNSDMDKLEMEKPLKNIGE